MVTIQALRPRARFSLVWMGLLLILGGCGVMATPPVNAPAPTATGMLLPSPWPTVSAAPATENTPDWPAPSLGGIIPKPVSVTPGEGRFLLTPQTNIYLDPPTEETERIAQFLAERLRAATGYPIEVRAAEQEQTDGNLYLVLDASAVALGSEGYELTITPQRVVLQAARPAGLFYGVQTIRQLLPAAIESPTPQEGKKWEIASGKILDYPRFAWRGAMLDVARHFFTVDEVKRYIDYLAYYKMNRLHLHLSDDQGWRLEIRSWPRLATYGGSLEVGGTRGGYYTQEEYAEIVAYAASQFITVIPEIDMPGHVQAALASYPELNCNDTAPDLYTGTDVGFSSLCIDKDITYTFAGDVIRELAALTPGDYLHIGGDEAHATKEAAYKYFIRQVQAIVAVNGKKVIGWEEIAQAPLLSDTLVQHWNPGEGHVREAVRQGAQVIMSPADKAYLDMKYDAATRLGLDWAGYIPVQAGYSWEPTALVSGVGEENIAGIEAPLWSETVTNLDDIEYLAFPRLPGYAEIGWSPAEGRDWSEYRRRLATHAPRWSLMGIDFYRSPDVPWP